MSNNVNIQLPDGQTASVVREDAKVVTSISQQAQSVTVSASYVQSAGQASDKHFSYTINVGAWNVTGSQWYIDVTHSLDKFPSVTVIDSFNRILTLDVEYIDENTARLFSTAVFSGKAYFN